jgi:hypothetical protein
MPQALRTVAVHSGGILEALHKIHKVEPLTRELEAARKR